MLALSVAEDAKTSTYGFIGRLKISSGCAVFAIDRAPPFMTSFRCLFFRGFHCGGKFIKDIVGGFICEVLLGGLDQVLEALLKIVSVCSSYLDNKRTIDAAMRRIDTAKRLEHCSNRLSLRV